MTSPGSNIVRSVRDVLREVRYSVRREAGLIDETLNVLGDELRANAPPFVPLSQPPVLRLTDALFGSLEKAAVLAFAPERTGAAYPYLEPVSHFVIFEGGRRKLDGAAFVQAQHRFARDLLHGFGVENLLLSEQAIEAARQRLESQHGELVAALSSRAVRRLTPGERDARVRFCAAAAVMMNDARPIRRLDLPRHRSASAPLVQAPNLYCFALMALATALVSTAELDPRSGTADAVEAAAAVTEARFARFSAAVTQRDPVAALAREFEAVLPYLP